MKQKGTVIKTNGEFATVEVMRTSACAGCSKQEGCIACKKKTLTKAYNPLDARAGDTVTLETSSATVIFYALLVFILPIVLTITAFLCMAALNTQRTLQIAVSACIFILTYVIIYFVFDRNPKTKKSVVISDIDKR